MTINLAYDLKELVYLIHDPDQLSRMITGVKLNPEGDILYQLSCGEVVSYHYECELATEKNWTGEI
jgi:hypothetical protein